MALKKKKNPLKGSSKVTRARKKVARKTERKGGIGSSSHRTKMYTPAELKVQQGALSGKGKSVAKKKNYKAAVEKIQKQIGEKKTSASQRAKRRKRVAVRR